MAQECRRVMDLWVGSCHGSPIVGFNMKASPNVKNNDFEVVRVMDVLLTSCPKCGGGIVTVGSPNVYANDFPVHRVGDAVNYGAGSGVSALGSPDVHSNT